MRCPEMVVKIAEMGIAPFDTSKDDYQSFMNIVKEYANRLLGSTTYGVAGGGAGAGLGAGIGRIIGGRAGTGPGAVVGGYLGAIPAALAGDVTSLRKTEKATGVKPTGFGQYMGRNFLGSSFGPIGDWAASRKLQKHPEVKE